MRSISQTAAVHPFTGRTLSASRRQDIITLVTEASDHALQGADDAVAHILPELRLRKVIPRNQR